MEVIAAPRFPRHPHYKKSKEPAASEDGFFTKTVSMVGSFFGGGGGGGGNKKNQVANSHKVYIL